MKAIKIITCILLILTTVQLNAQIINEPDLYKDIYQACLSSKPNELSTQTADKFCKCIAYETASRALINKNLLPADNLKDFYDKVEKYDGISKHNEIAQICLHRATIVNSYQDWSGIKEVIAKTQPQQPVLVKEYGIKYEKRSGLFDSADKDAIYNSMSWIDQLHSNFEHSRAKSELKKYEQELAQAQKNRNVYRAEIALAKIQRQQEIIDHSHPIEPEKIATLIIVFSLILVGLGYVFVRMYLKSKN